MNLELGSNAPLIVNDDGDWETAADKAKLHAFSHAGQSCISIQRILVHEDDRRRLHEALRQATSSRWVGDPMDEDTDVGPLISRDDRDRVKEWIDEAVSGGAELLTGGELVDEGRCLAPTVLAHALARRQGLVRGDLRPRRDDPPLHRLRRGAGDGQRLQVRPPGRRLHPRHRPRARGRRSTLEFGGVLINEVPTFRTDQMPYGGVKDSGNTREGPAYAVRELTEERFISLQ